MNTRIKSRLNPILKYFNSGMNTDGKNERANNQRRQTSQKRK